MADIATPSAATMSTIDAGSEPAPEKASKARPERPDEQQYKESLAKAEKDYAAAQEKFVRASSCAFHTSRADHPVLECDQGQDRPRTASHQGFPRRQKTARASK